MANFVGTADVDRFVGGSEDDQFYFWPGYMTATDKVDGGGGKNSLWLLNDYETIWTDSKADWPGFSNIAGIALLSKPYIDGMGEIASAGFNLTFDNNVFKANKSSHFILDASGVGLGRASLQLNASTVTNVGFDVFGTTGYFSKAYGEEDSYDNLRTGSKNDRFVFYANSLNNDVIDGGAGTDTIVLAGAGRTTSQNGHDKTDPSGFTFLMRVKNVENIVITDLAAGQSRKITFGHPDAYQGRNAITITTDRNYGTEKSAAPVDGKLIFDGSNLKSTKSIFDITGGNAGDILIGGAANDHLSGGKGNDILVGGYGDDWLSGGQGNDQLLAERSLYTGDVAGGAFGTIGNIKMYGGEGNDTFKISPYQWEPGIHKHVISGGDGTDVLQFSVGNVWEALINCAAISGMEIVKFDDPDVLFEVSEILLKKNHDESGKLRIENRPGGTNWTANIDASDNTDARYSVHIAIRSEGKEILAGGMGNDIFDYTLIGTKSSGRGLNAGDTINGGGGIDTILVEEGRDTILGNRVTGVERLKVVNESTAGEKTNIIIGTTEAISIDGSTLNANDTLTAQGYFKDPKTGKVSEATASLSIIGGKGDDSLTGGSAGDKLYGGDGDDILTGYKGLDRLAGGKGADHFVFKNTYESLVTANGRDVITDFHHSEGDKIQFLHDTSTPYSFIGAGGFHGKAGEVRSFISGNNTYVQLDADGDGVADLGIALYGKISLTSADFLL